MADFEGQTILEVRELNTIFGNKHVLKDFSLAIRKGETIGIVGATGSGKSIAVRSMLRLLDSTEAKVSFERIAYLGLDSIGNARATEIALVFQDANIALNPVQKCGIQIQKVIRKHLKLDSKIATEKTLDLLQKVEIKDPERIYYSFPHQVSGGELQRVMIAMGMSCNPQLLILDEPASALDKIVQKGIIQLLQKLRAEEGLAIILISHDLEMISVLAERVLHISDGMVVSNQEVSAFFTSPESVVSRSLIRQLKDFRSGTYQNLSEGKEVLRVEGLGKQFDTGKWAFRDVSFTLQASETLGIIGESGSGKSSLAKVLAGIWEETEGAVIFADGETTATYVFQDAYSSMDPEFCVREILWEVIRLQKGEAGSPEKLLAQVLLEPDILTRRIHQLSGGQRQRVNLARALATNPKILICDEVTSGLDLNVQFEIIDLLKSRLSEIAIVFISHDISLIKNFTHKILVMKEGKVENQGETKEIFENAKPGYTFDLINSSHDVKYFINI